jgi:outer membrane protein
MKRFALFLFACACGFAEVRTMTLRQVLDLALQQSPDLMLARLDQAKARNQVTIAKDPFIPKVFGGSGAAYTHGFPNSIEGNAPSVFQTRTQMALFDRPQSYRIEQAKEDQRGLDATFGSKEDEVAYKVAVLFLDAEQAQLGLTAAQRENENLARVQELTRARVGEGRELPIEEKKANMAVLVGRQRVESLSIDLINAEISLAEALGLAPDDRVQPATEERGSVQVPASEDSSIAAAMENSKELKRIQSNLQSKQLEIKSYRAERLPKANLVAQYSLFLPYFYQNYFTQFHYNNFQLGASFEVPLVAGRAARAYAAQSQADADKLRIEYNRTRTRISGDLRRAYQEVQRADTSRDVARADLELARDQVALDLAQNTEGRLPLAKLEASRATENEKWLAFYQAQHNAERARLDVLRQTGGLLAALR